MSFKSKPLPVHAGAEPVIRVGPGAIDASGDIALVAAGGCAALNLLAADLPDPTCSDPKPCKAREFITGRAVFCPATDQMEPCVMISSFFLQTRGWKAQLPSTEFV